MLALTQKKMPELTLELWQELKKEILHFQDIQFYF